MGGYLVFYTLAQKTLWYEGLEGLFPLAFQAMLGVGCVRLQVQLNETEVSVCFCLNVSDCN